VLVAELCGGESPLGHGHERLFALRLERELELRVEARSVEARLGGGEYEAVRAFDHFEDVPMNDIPKVVFSSTLERADWPDSRIAGGDLAEEIAALKREPGKDMIAWGGAAFAQSLTRLGLVDEYRLILQPVALGDGLPLFKDLSAPVRLELVDAQTYDTGAALHVYRPAPAAS
jgi:dihydrofolate reductase